MVVIEVGVKSFLIDLLLPLRCLETALKAWRNEDGTFRSKGFCSLSFLSSSRVWSPVYALAVFSKKLPKDLRAFSRLGTQHMWGVYFCYTFQQRHKGKGGRYQPLCYSTVLYFCYVQKTEGIACSPRTPPFSDSWSMSQALEPILGSQHLFWASNSPESVAQSTEPWPKVFQPHMGYGCVKHLAIIHTGITYLSPDDWCLIVKWSRHSLSLYNYSIS